MYSDIFGSTGFEETQKWDQLKKVFEYESDQPRQFKWCENCIIELRYPTPEEVAFECNEDRTVNDKRFAKYRANAMYVIGIWNLLKNQWQSACYHVYQTEDWETIYTYYCIGTLVKPHKYCDDSDTVCAPGIHYFKSLQAAFLYGHPYQVFRCDGEMESDFVPFALQYDIRDPKI
jgi:hypothetical protein